MIFPQLEKVKFFQGKKQGGVQVPISQARIPRLRKEEFRNSSCNNAALHALPFTEISV
ncbi:conserved hypothetical protein [Ricinus communis]|uniref:Uncharacterized protein n=1 Tax=Ricinus communis TaxID=3988 RepID=B9SZM6_RICCO|nr:conserved hypothetical protein [Ricinus communis]